MGKKRLKIGVERGGGPPPGYRWSVLILDVAFREAMKFLDADQYRYLRVQIRELAREPDPTHGQTASIDAVEDFHELRDKGGILGNINVRVFFGLDKARTAIVVLSTINKKNDGPTLSSEVRRIRRRWKEYQRGEYDTR